LAAYTLVLGLIFHAYWLAPAAEARFERIIFFNHISIIGGMLALVAFGGGCLSLDAAMRRKS
jgi:putative oxidoreductase